MSLGITQIPRYPKTVCNRIACSWSWTLYPFTWLDFCSFHFFSFSTRREMREIKGRGRGGWALTLTYLGGSNKTAKQSSPPPVPCTYSVYLVRNTIHYRQSFGTWSDFLRVYFNSNKTMKAAICNGGFSSERRLDSPGEFWKQCQYPGPILALLSGNLWETGEARQYFLQAPRWV